MNSNSCQMCIIIVLEEKSFIVAFFLGNKWSGAIHILQIRMLATENWSVLPKVTEELLSLIWWSLILAP